MVKGDQVYPHRRDLHGKNFWRCPWCMNFVGTHHGGNGKSPLGCIPNKAMKAARQHIHRILDPVWKSGKMTRTEVYKRVSDHIGKEYHTAELRTIEEARSVYKFIISGGLS